MTTPWENANWSVSPYNFAEQALANFPHSMEIHDTTLRDGISDPARGISITIDQKVKIAQALDELGVRRIEVGLTNDAEAKDLKTLANSGLKAKTFAMIPTTGFIWDEWKAVDIALSADLSGIICNFPASKYLIEKYLPGWTPEKMLQKSVGMVEYAKAHGLFVNLFEYDTTRADPAYLENLLRAAVQAKTDSVSIVDTLGVVSPAGVAYLVELIKSWVDVPIELHMHDDFGLAYANTIAGMGVGAQVAQTTVNGIGRMAATEDVMTTLRILYGQDLGFKYEKIYETCKTIRETGKWSISPYKPISGALAFAYDSDGRIDENKSQRAPFLPEFIGHKYQILLNQKTGPQGIRSRLTELGKSATDEQVGKILTLVKERATQTGQNLSDNEYTTIVKQVIH
jgi:isopropylmalate/homocitrate/citramalate synthase